MQKRLQNNGETMAVRSILTDEVKRACDEYLASKGERKMSWKEMANLEARKADRRRKIPPEDPLEKIAQQIERESQE